MIQRPAFLLAVGLVAMAQPLTLDNRAVIQLVQSAAGEDTVLAMIQGADGKYSLNPDDVARLKQAGVSNRVIRAMTEKISNPSRPAQVTVPEPEIEGVYYWFDETNQRLQPLSIESGVTKSKAKHVLAGAKTTLEITGESSPTKLKAADHLAFLVRIRGGAQALSYMPAGFDFSTMTAKLYAFTSQKGKRERTIGEETITPVPFVGKYKDKTQADVALTVTRAAGNILKLTARRLPPGEYALIEDISDTKYFTFSVVP